MQSFPQTFLRIDVSKYLKYMLQFIQKIPIHNKQFLVNLSCQSDYCTYYYYYLEQIKHISFSILEYLIALAESLTISIFNTHTPHYERFKICNSVIIYSLHICTKPISRDSLHYSMYAPYTRNTHTHTNLRRLSCVSVQDGNIAFLPLHTCCIFFNEL